MPKPGINGPSTVVAYPGRVTITEKDVEFIKRLRQGLSAWTRPRGARTGLHVVPRRRLHLAETMGSCGLGRRHRHDEQAHGRHGYGGSERQAVAQGPAASARLSRDQLRSELRRSARLRIDDGHAARRGSARQGDVHRIRHAEGRVANGRPIGQNPYFDHGRQRLDDRSRPARMRSSSSIRAPSSSSTIRCPSAAFRTASPSIPRHSSGGARPSASSSADLIPRPGRWIAIPIDSERLSQGPRP